MLNTLFRDEISFHMNILCCSALYTFCFLLGKCGANGVRACVCIIYGLRDLFATVRVTYVYAPTPTQATVLDAVGGSFLFYTEIKCIAICLKRFLKKYTISARTMPNQSPSNKYTAIWSTVCVRINYKQQSL